MLKVEELEKQLNQGSTKGIYLLYGEDKPQFVRKTILLNSKYKCYNEM